jgi:Ca2+/H+ antiporter, TMEM165/GDT1 family
VSPAIAVTAFALVFLAELPDKTALAALVLGSRYRPLHVYVGIAAAFAVHVALAVTAGGLLSLLPHRILEAVVAVLFLVGTALLLRGHRGREDPGKAASTTNVTFLRAAATGFGVILVAEFGDLTQIVIASLTARYHQPLAVGVGGLLALWAVAAIAIVGGRGLLRLVPAKVLTGVAAALMAVLAVISLVSAVGG